MALKFRLNGLAETFIDTVRCPKCGHHGGSSGDQGFETDLTKVTLNGIVVVASCQSCKMIFVPDGQRQGVINSEKLRHAIQKNSRKTGEPVLLNREEVALEVEKLNAERNEQLH